MVVVYIILYFVSLSQDIYAPLLSEMAVYFSSSLTKVQLVLPSQLFGLALSRALSGPIIDNHNRYNIAKSCMMIITICQLVILSSRVLEIFLFMRFFQSIGFGTIIIVLLSSLSYAEKKNHVKTINSSNIAWNIGVISGPAWGIILFHWLNLKCLDIFIILFILFASGYFLLGKSKSFISKEIGPGNSKTTKRLSYLSLFQEYAQIQSNKKIILFSLICGLHISIYLSFMSNAHWVYSQELGLEMNFFMIFQIFPSITTLISSIIFGFFLQEQKVYFFLTVSVILCSISCLYTFILILCDSYELLDIIFIMMLQSISASLTLPIYLHLAIMNLPNNRATSISLATFIRSICACVFVSVSNIYISHNQNIKAQIVFFCFTFATLVALQSSSLLCKRMSKAVVYE